MEELLSPKELRNEYFLDNQTKKTIEKTRIEISNILCGKDKRLLILIGPCSIDNEKATMDYARKLNELNLAVKDKILLVMRTYFEKPRTTIGWKGLVYDPNKDNSNNIQQGIKVSRKLLIEINKLGIGTATEFLSPLVPNYLSDCISYASIGARTTQSQTHREFASNLHMPLGFKNSTNGDIQIAIDAITSAKCPHSYINISDEGKIAKIESNGNQTPHLILRGGLNGPNFDQKSVNESIDLLKNQNLEPHLIIDCSHANSNKKFENQPIVAKEIIKQRKKNKYIAGIMIESYLEEGKGNKFGQSITDECISWQTTQKLIYEIYDFL